ncbi:CBS domain-containing protein [Natronospora cellulosivora (SeqCode)]
MDIIVSHQVTDLDGLGAMVAAARLYSDAKPVFVGRLHRVVKDFLVLYKDEIRIYNNDEIDYTEVSRVIIVDTYTRDRLGKIQKKIDWDNVEVIMYDHHPHEKQEWVDLDLSEDVGSATTILINKLNTEGLELNPFEATVCALAIYADTGNLTHLNTTPNDVRALAFLLEAGANLKLINNFIKEPLNSEQEKLVEDLLEHREDIRFNGSYVSIFSIDYDKYVAGVNRVVEHLKKLYHLDNLFVIFSNDNTRQIIGRSSDEAVNVGKICSVFGGGGHNGAAAAKVEDKPLSLVKEELIEVIKQNVQPLIEVREIMSSPVRTITANTSVEEVEQSMKKYGHNGFVVLANDGSIEGVFSRKDIDKVKGHGLMHAPVKSYMSKDIITIDAAASVDRARDLMVKNAVGRIPVLEGAKLLGIITRSDVLAAYHGSDTPFQYKHRYGSSMVNIEKREEEFQLYLDKLDKKTYQILEKIGEIAEKHNVEAYLIGGMIRDLYLDRPSRDLDIVIDGSMQEFVQDLANNFESEYSYNSEFKTATIVFEDGFNIDLATCRKEIYQYTGALPEVERSNIVADLFRRDYTVNTLAVSLNPENWAILIDFFDGRNDLKNRNLRALHRFSFLDDPTRIIRGIRLVNKFDFTFEEESESLIKECLISADFTRLSEVRVLKEIQLLLSEPLTKELINLVKEFPIFNLFTIDIEIKEKFYQQANDLERILEQLDEKIYNKIELWILRMAVFCDELSKEYVEDWTIKDSYKETLTSYSANKALLAELNQKIDPVEIVNMLSNLSHEILLILYIKSEKELVKKNIKHYLEYLIDIDTSINGHDLINIGLEPGPKIKEVLDKVYQARLRGEINTHQEELSYARELINN